MIPLFGLLPGYSVSRFATVQDCSGNLVKGDETFVYSDICARFTSMKLQDEVQIFGNASGKRWQVTMVPIQDAFESDLILVPVGIYPNFTAADQYFRILRINHKMDFSGCVHHSHLIAELDD